MPEPEEPGGLVRVVTDHLPDPVEADPEYGSRRFERREGSPPLSQEESALGGLGASHRQLEPRQLREHLVRASHVALRRDQRGEVSERQDGVGRECADGDPEDLSLVARQEAHGKIFSRVEPFFLSRAEWRPHEAPFPRRRLTFLVAGNLQGTCRTA